MSVASKVRSCHCSVVQAASEKMVFSKFIVPSLFVDFEKLKLFPGTPS